MNDLELIKSKIDIVSFLSEFIQLKKAGRNFKALCPFHSEKTPSFVVSPERQSWHCFGACNIGGDIFDFLIKWENIEFVEALKLLAKKAGVTLSSYQPTEGLKIKERLYEINHLASEYYHYILKNHSLGKKALDYLKDRGINDKIMDTFSLGYAPNSWDGILKFLKKKNYTEGEIVSSGLAIKTDRGTLYDRFRGRLMFTLRDHRGNPVGFSGRNIGPDSDKEAKYINTPETPIYIKGNILYGLDKTSEPIRKTNEAIVVEGEFDFLSSWKVGVTNIVAIKGSSFTQGQVSLIKRYTENLLIALDSDFAGSQAAKKGIEAAEEAGLSLKVVELSYGKDPDECIQKDPSLWKKAVKDAVNIYDFLISKAFAQYNISEASGKKKIGDDLSPFLGKITNPIVLSHYIRLLSKKLEVSEEAVETLIEKSKSIKTATVNRPKDDLPLKKRDDLLEMYLLSLILLSPNSKKTYTLATTIIESSDFLLPPAGLIISSLNNYLKKHEKLDVKLFTKTLPPEVLTTFDTAYLKDFPSAFLNDSQLFSNEVKKTTIAIKQSSLRRRIALLTTKLRHVKDEAEEESLSIDIKNLVEKIDNLDKALS